MPKILVVDDEPDILKIVNFRLKKAGYEVAAATNGEDALDILREGKFDLILLDLVMPVMDGYEFYRIIKGDDGLKGIPVIVLSASAQKSTIEDTCKELKVEGYLLKPFDAEELLCTVRKILL